MKALIILLLMTVSQQLCHGGRKPSGPLEFRIRQKKQYLKDIPILALLSKDEKRELFIYEQTIVVRDAGLDDKVRRCEVIEAYGENEAKDKLALFTSPRLKAQELDMERMMALLSDCDSVDDMGDTKVDAKEIKGSPNSLTNGIFPGTKWCGLGDIADRYHDLGKLHNVDRCCRNHDYCPIKVLKKTERYHLTNKALYTKSHCMCDEAFYNCLKKLTSWASKFLGNLYFYAASPQCITGLPEHTGEDMKFIPATKEW